ASPAAADVLAELAHDLHGVEPAGNERLVEVDDEEHTPVVARGHDRAVRLLLLADPVGKVPQRATFEASHLDEDDTTLGVLGDDLGLLGLSWPLRFLARALQLAAQRIGPAGPLVQQRERLARGDGLDAPGASADRALRQDSERPDLRGGADVRAAAELERPAVDVDHAHDVAVLLPEEHHRAELARLRERRLEDPHRQGPENPPGPALAALARSLRARRYRL